MSTSFVDAHTQGIGEFIQHRRFFCVPDHQRDFAWTDEEVEQFLNDVVGAIQDSEQDYFLGLLVVVEPEKHGEAWEILDGQQRLATTTMVYAAIREWLHSAGFDSDAIKLQNDYIAFRELGEAELYPRLTLNINNRTMFREIVVDRNNDHFLASKHEAAPRYSSERRLIEAARTCRSWVSELALKSSDKPSEQAKALFNLANYMRDKVKIVAMDVASTANAYRIFETLNDRGLDLSALDLVKNHLFGRSSNRLSEVQSNWLRMLSNISGKQADDFLKTFWTSRWGRIQRGRLFDEWRAKYDSSSPGAVVNLSADLDQAADRFSALEMPEHDTWNEYSSMCKRAIKSLSLLGSRQAWPVMLAALDAFSPQEMERLLNHLITLTVRYQTIGRRRTGRLEIASARVALGIFEGELNTPHKVWKEYSSIVPSDEEFMEDFGRWSDNKSARVRYILAELEKAEFKQSNNGADPEESPLWEELTLEHIFPVNPGSEWSNELKYFPALRQEYLHKLGNLCLLQKHQNNKLGNRGFSYKKEHLYVESELTLTSQIALTYSQWDPDSIDHRQKQLGSLALIAWPLPPH